MLTIVIGDIHGMAAKLENLLGQIDMWCAANARAERRQLIFLGDYIDRGPDSRQVLQIVQRLQAEGAICLRGNHEELILRATESEGDLTNFLANGGDATITSLRTPAAFWRTQEWVRALPTSHEDELRYYMHAGIRPGGPPRPTDRRSEALDSRQLPSSQGTVPEIHCPRSYADDLS
jgi:serine/threonine protein phosphatase 1